MTLQKFKLSNTTIQIMTFQTTAIQTRTIQTGHLEQFDNENFTCNILTFFKWMELIIISTY